jgi:hypothetical protein
MNPAASQRHPDKTHPPSHPLVEVSDVEIPENVTHHSTVATPAREVVASGPASKSTRAAKHYQHIIKRTFMAIRTFLFGRR